MNIFLNIGGIIKNLTLRARLFDVFKIRVFVVHLKVCKPEYVFVCVCVKDVDSCTMKHELCAELVLQHKTCVTKKTDWCMPLQLPVQLNNQTTNIINTI